jgi:hypothetical protein
MMDAGSSTHATRQAFNALAHATRAAPPVTELSTTALPSDEPPGDTNLAPTCPSPHTTKYASFALSYATPGKRRVPPSAAFGKNVPPRRDCAIVTLAAVTSVAAKRIPIRERIRSRLSPT